MGQCVAPAPLKLCGGISLGVLLVLILYSATISDTELSLGCHQMTQKQQAFTRERFRNQTRLHTYDTHGSMHQPTETSIQPLTDRTEAGQCSQENRQRLLHDTCEWGVSHGLVDARPERLKDGYMHRAIFVDDVHKVLYCEVPKVACTSWKVFFANISGKVDPQDFDRLHELVHATTYYPQVGFRYLNSFTHGERLYRLKHYFKFLVIRNPFLKLISAFEDKFLQNNYRSLWYHQNVGTHIMKKYRDQPSKEALEKGNGVRFEELVRFITDDQNEIQYKYDPHWWSMQDTCYPCIIQYDYIAKLETLEQDLPYIMDQIEPSGRHSFPYLNTNQHQMEEKLSAYYGNLTTSELNKIKQLYLVDNEMFGYTMDNNSYECNNK